MQQSFDWLTPTAVIALLVAGAVTVMPGVLGQIGDGTWELFGDRDNRVRVDLEGDVDLAPDGSGVLWISNGGYLDVRRTRGRDEQRVRFTGRNGMIDREYWRDGDARGWDAEADGFVSEIMPILLRETGISAGERVAGPWRVWLSADSSARPAGEC